jgi:putative oxidoreductase
MSKIFPAVPRVILGAVFFLAGLAGLLHLGPTPVLDGPAGALMNGLTGSYLFTLVKLTEVAAGVLLLSNRFVPLALTVLAPVLVNIVAFHALYQPTGLAVPLVLLASELWLAWKLRKAFAPMLASKTPAEPQEQGVTNPRTAAAS